MTCPGHRSQCPGYLPLLSWRSPYHGLFGDLRNFVAILIRFEILRVVDVVFGLRYDNSSRVGWIG